MKQAKIAILGWGSLLWDTEKNKSFDQQHESWNFDGPVVPLEFCRRSRDRRNALTLVIDTTHGSPCRIAWCLSRATKVEDAIEDLRIREGTNRKSITSINVFDSDELSTFPSIRTWAKEKNIEFVVWTGLGSNFRNFSVEAGIRHLERLPESAKAKAAEYIWKAPEFVQTKLRNALKYCKWFLDEENRQRNLKPEIFHELRCREEETFHQSERELGSIFALAGELLLQYDHLVSLALNTSPKLKNDIQTSAFTCALRAIRKEASSAILALLRGNLAGAGNSNRRALELCAFAAKMYIDQQAATYWNDAATSKLAREHYERNFPSWKLVKEILPSELVEAFEYECSTVKLDFVAVTTELAACDCNEQLRQFDQSSSVDDPNVLFMRFLSTIAVHTKIMNFLSNVLEENAHLDTSPWKRVHLPFLEKIKEVRN